MSSTGSKIIPVDIEANGNCGRTIQHDWTPPKTLFLSRFGGFDIPSHLKDSPMTLARVYSSVGRITMRFVISINNCKG